LPKELFWNLLLGNVDVNKLLSVDQRANFLIFDEMRMIGSKKVANYFVRLDSEPLG